MRPRGPFATGLVVVARWPVAFALVAAPLAFGAVVPVAYLPLLAILFAAGLASWWRWRQPPAEPTPTIPGARILVALLAVVALQLVPLPPWFHRVFSPGTYALHYLPLPDRPGWFPLTVSPPGTRWALVFLAALSLGYATTVREAQHAAWRRRLAATLVVAGALLSLVGLIQASSPEPRAIYGVIRPPFDWAVFGPYVNRNHFAGHLAMVTPVAIGFAVGSLGRAADLRRRAGLWGAVGSPEASTALWQLAVAGLLLAGLLRSQSRGGILSLLAGLMVQAFLSRRRGVAALVVAVLVIGGVVSVDLSGFFSGFDSRGFNRLALWQDLWRLVPQFPVFGFGLGAFGVAYRPYQTVLGRDLVPAAHNDYLQLLLETGFVGAALGAALVVVVVREAWRRRGEDPLGAGLFAGVATSMVHAAGDFSWQMPANAATFAVLAGLAMARSRRVP